MQIITEGKDKGWCRCERSGGLLVPDSARYAAHLQECDGTDSYGFDPAWITTPVPEKNRRDADLFTGVPSTLPQTQSA